MDTGGSLTKLHAFVSARYAAQAGGSTLTSWIVRPAVAEALSKRKVETGSNQTPLFWGIPKQHVMFVQRKDTTVERFPAVQQDGTYIRAVARSSLAFLNQVGVVRGYDVA